MKAVYIGAGLDIEPLNLHINDFIYIDSLPFSEHGTTAYTEYHEEITCTKKTRIRNLFSRPRFLTTLEENMSEKGYKIVKRTGDFIVFKNTKKIKYYYSCSFPEFVEDELRNELKTCDTIIACGYNPDPVILDYIKPRPLFIGNNNTSYEGDALFGVLHENPGLIRSYLNMDTMDTYNSLDALKKYQNF